MRIGIDAPFLTHPQVGGFKTYTQNIISGLNQIDHDTLYDVYVDRSDKLEWLPCGENFTYHVVDGKIPVFRMPVREQVRLRIHFIKDRPDILHFLCNTAPINIKSKYIITLHDTIQVTNSSANKVKWKIADYKRWAINTYSKWSILNTVRRASRIITVSNFEKQQINKHLGIAHNRINVTYLAPNPVFAQAAPESRKLLLRKINYDFGLQGEYVLGVGYEERKNIPLLIKSFSIIASDFPGLTLVIVAGHQERRLYFQRLVADLGLDRRVIILPALPPEELANLYNLAEVFVFPSERESFGLPPLEAMSCGTPTIAMNSSSIPEILQDGAVLIDSKDANQWASAIRHVIINKSLRSNLIDRGLKRAAEFSWNKCARDTVDIYRSLAVEDY